MRVMALDTTTATGWAALLEDDRVLAEHIGDPLRAHAEQLPGLLVHLLETVGLALPDVDAFAVATGPGSFTGLRIGIATIQGLAFVTGRPVVAVSALEALAHIGGQDEPAGSLVAVWIDARREEVFRALYRVERGPVFSPERLTLLDPPAVDGPRATLARWETEGWLPAVYIGSGVQAYRDFIAASDRIRPYSSLAPVIGRIAGHRVRAGDTIRPGDLHPLYIRRPDAELAREKLNRAG